MKILLVLLVICSACAPTRLGPTCAPTPQGACVVVLDTTRVRLGDTTLAIYRAGDLSFERTLADGDHFKQLVALGGNRIAYSVLHCPNQCLTADVVILDHLDKPAEVFHAHALTAGARIAVASDGGLDIVDQVFQPGDMCCPSGTSTTHLTWNGVTYVAR